MFLLIAVFILSLLISFIVVGFIVVNALSVIFTLFGFTVPAFGVIHYLASGFLLVYTRGYFNKDSNIFSVFKDAKLKFNKE